ncbi:CoA transferase [Ramlibacter sp.]|uniref:CoA transferase n=1 Tax=Ramlibacter sp. TaxID=1917967 RepID=UPI003D14B7F9
MNAAAPADSGASQVDARDALAGLVAQSGVDVPIANVTLTGDDSPLASPHRLATASGVALAAQAAAVAEIWRLRTGRSQDVRVDFADAAHALNPAEHLLQNGYPLTVRFVFQEPGNGFFRAKDAWIYMAHGSPRLRNGILDVLRCANTKPALMETVGRWNAEELESICQERGLPLVKVRDAAQWRASPHGRFLAGRPVIDIERIADGAPLPFGEAARPLSGIRVLENTHILAGPGIGRCLAEQGADALRIAPPRTSDPINFMIDTGFGKRSAFLDLDADADVARYKALANDADIVVQSLRPDALERRGLGPRELAASSRKGLVYVSVSCYGGVDGPWSRYVGYDPIAQAATGIAVEEGGADAPRVVPSHLLADYLTAYLGTFGALAGLIRRARDGGSYHVRISLAQTCLWVQDLGLRLPRPSPEEARRGRPRIATMDSPFGELHYLAPVAQYSRTPAYWDSPPVPLGASRAEWGAR